jgi:hypothetical protein
MPHIHRNTLALATLVALSVPVPVRAIVVATPTGPVKAAHADLVITGKVTALDGTQNVAPTPAVKDKAAFQIAVLQATEVVKGEAKDKKVRVGFLTGKLPSGVKPGSLSLKLAPGQDGLFFLKKHHQGDFYVLPMINTFIPSKTKAAHDRELGEARKTVKLLENPMLGLKSTDAIQRLEAISILIPVYCTAPLGSDFKQQPLDAAESKLILKILLDADWNPEKYKGDNFQQNPAGLFKNLGLTAKDGFHDPQKGLFAPEYAAAARAWLTKNWQTYPLQKVVITGEAK